MKSRTSMWGLSVWLFAALAMPAQARIVYTPVNVYLPTSGSYPIDLNHDGITDFTSSRYHADSMFPLDPAYRYPFRSRHTQAGGIVGTNVLLHCQIGVQIDSSQSFYGG